MTEIDKKFVDVVPLKNISLFGVFGYEKALSINKTIKYDLYEVVCENGTRLKCADNHIIIDKDGNQIFASESLGCYVKTIDGISKVIKVRDCHKKVHMYDFTMGDDTSHCYYAGNKGMILSHNTTICTILCLWMTCFFEGKKVLILANKAATSNKILSRLKIAYEYLPAWVKPKVTVWNKTSIEFNNDSAIRAFASSSDAARGFSSNCVTGDSKVTIRFRFFPWMKFTIPIKWMKYFSIFCKQSEKNTKTENDNLDDIDLVIQVE